MLDSSQLIYYYLYYCRYCRGLGHQPLFLSLPVPKDLPKRCSYCGGPVSCELQLLPTLIHSLKIKSCEIDAGIEFGNVLVYTCFKSCWGDENYRREQIWIEAEASPNHFLIVDSVSTGIASKAESELFVKWCVSDDPIKFFDFLQGVVPNIGHHTQHYSKH